MKATELDHLTIPRTKFREGYEIDEVDAFLAAARAALYAHERRAFASAQPPLSASDVVAARFVPTKFRAGYDQDHVDELLDRIAAALTAHETTAV